MAEQDPGFDIIFAGHDHQLINHWEVNRSGDSVLVMDPGSHARFAGEATIVFHRDGKKKITGKLVPMSDNAPSAALLADFQDDFHTVKTYLQDTFT